YRVLSAKARPPSAGVSASRRRTPQSPAAPRWRAAPEWAALGPQAAVRARGVCRARRLPRLYPAALDRAGKEWVLAKPRAFGQATRHRLLSSTKRPCLAGCCRKRLQLGAGYSGDRDAFGARPSKG